VLPRIESTARFRCRSAACDAHGASRRRGWYTGDDGCLVCDRAGRRPGDGGPPGWRPAACLLRHAPIDYRPPTDGREKSLEQSLIRRRRRQRRRRKHYLQPSSFHCRAKLDLSCGVVGGQTVPRDKLTQRVCFRVGVTCTPSISHVESSSSIRPIRKLN